MTESASTPEMSGRDLESRPNLDWLESEIGGERFSFATALQHSFAEIDAGGALPMEYYYPVIVPPEIPPTDREVAHNLIKEVMDRLYDNSVISDARLKMKNEGPESLDKFERQAVVRAYEKVRDDAIKAVDMTDEQRHRLQFQTISELNRGLRTAILTGAAPETWMVLDPKLKKIDGLDSQQVVRYMRNLLTTEHSDKIKAEIRTIKETANENEAAAAALTELTADGSVQSYV